MGFKIKYRIRTPEERQALVSRLMLEYLTDANLPMMQSHLGWATHTSTYVSQTGSWTWSVPYLEPTTTHIYTANHGTTQNGV